MKPRSKSTKSTLKKASWILRIFSGIVDYSLFFLLEMLFVSFLPFYFEEIFYFILAAATPLLWIPCEALLTSTWGTTMGKAMCGIVVRTGKGEKVNFKNALLKACCLKKSEAYSFSKNTFFRVTQWIVIGGTVIGCWGSTILGIPVMNQYMNVYEEYYSTPIAKDGWINYVADAKGFTVLLPSYPEETSQSFDNPHTRDALTYHEYKSCNEKEKVCYSVGYLDLPRSWRFAGANTLLKGALGIVVEHEAGSSLVNSSLSRHQKNPAIDFEISKDSNVLKGKLVLIGRTMYRIMVTEPAGSARVDSTQMYTFMDSFQMRYQGMS